jgi:hypothetical protein
VGITSLHHDDIQLEAKRFNAPKLQLATGSERLELQVVNGHERFGFGFATVL